MTAPIRFHNGSAFCARCNALMLRDYPNPLRFHEPQDCTRSSGDAAAQEQIVDGLRLVGAAGKTHPPTELVGGRNREPLVAEPDSSSQSRLGGA